MYGQIDTSTNESSGWLYLTDEAEEIANQSEIISSDSEVIDLTVEAEAVPEDLFNAGIKYEQTEQVEVQFDSKIEAFEHSRNELKETFDGYLNTLLNKIEVQAQLLLEKDREIQEKELQLKLIPDLQSQLNRQEEDSKVNHFENQALKKQVQLLLEEKATSESIKKITRSILQEVERETLIREEELLVVRESNQEIENLKSEIEKLRKPWWQRFLTGISL